MEPMRRLYLISGFLVVTLSSVSARPWFVNLDSSTPEKRPENMGIYPTLAKVGGATRLYVKVHVHAGDKPPGLSFHRLYEFPASVSQYENIELKKTDLKDTNPDSTWYRGTVTLSAADVSHWTAIEFTVVPWLTLPLPDAKQYSVPDGPFYRIPLPGLKINSESSGAAP